MTKKWWYRQILSHDKYMDTKNAFEYGLITHTSIHQLKKLLIRNVMVKNNIADLTTGVKFDEGKVQLSILSKESLEAEARVFEYGAKKYSKNNYKLGMDWSRLLDAALRHIINFNNKEDFDQESNLNHLWHAKACLAMLIYYYENKVGKDDR